MLTLRTRHATGLAVVAARELLLYLIFAVVLVVEWALEPIRRHRDGVELCPHGCLAHVLHLDDPDDAAAFAAAVERARELARRRNLDVRVAMLPGGPALP